MRVRTLRYIYIFLDIFRGYLLSKDIVYKIFFAAHSKDRSKVFCVSFGVERASSAQLEGCPYERNVFYSDATWLF